LGAAMQRRLLRAAARTVGCRISAEETAKLMALAGLRATQPPVASRTGARLELGGGLRAERTAREIQLSVAEGEGAAAFVAREKAGKTAWGGAGGE
ncbi:MAG TPA: hypothetical protein VM865_05740, partial [Acidobacteriaceae bacterium]|nr:hypothetical protein [Acidobacteriaceae bacterium]